MNYLAITMGDPNGIGPEIAIKALVENDDYRKKAIIFGSFDVLNYYKDLLEVEIELNKIDSVNEFKEGQINVYDDFEYDFSKDDIGSVSAKAGAITYEYIAKAIELSLAGEVGPVVTGPLNKEALNKGGYNYAGHTEIFAELTDTDTYSMMLWSQDLAVLHATTHVSLRDACDIISQERIKECINLAQDAMVRTGVSEPRIAVAGLNPHSGEGGLFGDEEIITITPAIKEKASEGIEVTGPYPPDTVFLRAYQGEFDVVIAMYHDQGHIPMKMVAFDDGVNVTLGLPIIRTSVDHGTAFDIAGKGIAKADSMLAALELGKRFAENA